MRDYPPPPWHTRGYALFVPCLVPAEHVRSAPGLQVEARAARTLGLLGFVDYDASSPLSYRELLWMPARVWTRTDEGRRTRGFWVAKMYVDHPGSLRAGRELWALPKQRARFDVSAERVAVRCEDGAEVVIERGRSLPGGLGAPARASIVTLQGRDGGVIGFRGDMRGLLRPRSARVRVRDLDGTWQGLAQATRLGPWAAELDPFSAVMRSPRRVAQQASSQAPSPETRS